MASTDDEITELAIVYLAGQMPPHEYRNLMIVELMNLSLSRHSGEECEDDDRLTKLATAIRGK
jgi:hypothetical protein